MKYLKFIFWNTVGIFMAIAWEIVIYPFGWAWESFTDENGITCITINVFRYLVIIMLYYAMEWNDIYEEELQKYIKELEEENEKLKK